MSCYNFVVFRNKMKFKRISILLISLFFVFSSHCGVSSDAQGMAKKLKTMEKDIPLPYHDALPACVKKCAAEAVPCNFEQYSTFIEPELNSRSLPLEMKYLPFALSKMDPNFCNGDRRGYWTLPSVVGLRYGLNIDSQNDERLNLEASSCAALDYLAELNTKYNNWWLSILAFANSPNALHHTLILSDHIPELWDFHEENLLPNSQVISDFIAYVYLGNEGLLTFTEPITKIVNPVPEVVSSDTTNLENDSAIVNTEPIKLPQSAQTPRQNVIYYTVKLGDNLTKIAKEYHVSVSDLMQWNNLDSDLIFEGQKLTIKK